MYFKTALFSLLFWNAKGLTVWQDAQVKLPKSLSDFNAELVDTTVLIAGGCESQEGNLFNSTTGYFDCLDISDSLYSFDIQTREFMTLKTMPRQRYRYASAVINGKLWVVGGRDVKGDIIGEIDVYDIDTDTWETYGTIQDQFLRSDLDSFVNGNNMYLIGGYDLFYTAYDTVWYIDTSASTVGNLVIKPIEGKLNTPRGDIAGVTDADGKYGYILGGFTHVNDFCSALNSTERYDFAADTWEDTVVPPLDPPRADVALLIMNQKLYSVGGERQIPVCEIPDSEKPEAGEQTIPVDDVEVYDLANGGDWQILASTPESRYRFGAVAYEPEDTIWVFGGQTAYDSVCQCFKTTDTVYFYQENGGTSGAMATGGTTLFALVLGWAVHYWMM